MKTVTTPKNNNQHKVLVSESQENMTPDIEENLEPDTEGNAKSNTQLDLIPDTQENLIPEIHQELSETDDNAQTSPQANNRPKNLRSLQGLNRKKRYTQK